MMIGAPEEGCIQQQTLAADPDMYQCSAAAATCLCQWLATIILLPCAPAARQCVAPSHSLCGVPAQSMHDLGNCMHLHVCWMRFHQTVFKNSVLIVHGCTS